MATVELTKDNFSHTIKDSGIALVDFWAEWCGPCRRFSPIYEEASERHTDLTFAKLDTEAEQELSGVLQIQAIPTLMVFKQGQLIFRQAGLLNSSQLDDLIEQARSLDLDEEGTGADEDTDAAEDTAEAEDTDETQLA